MLEAGGGLLRAADFGKPRSIRLAILGSIDGNPAKCALKLKDANDLRAVALQLPRLRCVLNLRHSACSVLMPDLIYCEAVLGLTDFRTRSR